MTPYTTRYTISFTAITVASGYWASSSGRRLGDEGISRCRLRKSKT
jgi:hypothetical protein